MTKFKELEDGQIGLIMRDPKSEEIVQIGLTPEQSTSLQLFLSAMSKEQKLIKMSDEYNLVFKESLCTKCKQK